MLLHNLSFDAIGWPPKDWFQYTILKQCQCESSKAEEILIEPIFKGSSICQDLLPTKKHYLQKQLEEPLEFLGLLGKSHIFEMKS